MPDAPATWSDARLEHTRFEEIRWFRSIDSTNRYLLTSGAADGVVAVADEQTAGRGRLGRSWIAPPGAALLVSVLLRREIPPERMHLVTLALALAATDALPHVDARIKWPNDVVVDDRKLAGILAETDGKGAVVVGIGMNLRDDWFPRELQETATAVDVDRRELLVDLLIALDTWLDRLDDVVAHASARSATIGRWVRVELAHETFEGTAESLTPEGYLVVDGRVITSGDVMHVRPL
jgi:BirA family biotin operon repressor/biotin-[acetyl-CoA-carboxylase] ligase